jgi:hypothetical protein
MSKTLTLKSAFVSKQFAIIELIDAIVTGFDLL